MLIESDLGADCTTDESPPLDHRTLRLILEANLATRTIKVLSVKSGLHHDMYQSMILSRCVPIHHLPQVHLLKLFIYTYFDDPNVIETSSV